MRFASALGATALSAVLFGLAFPPVHLKPLAWVCLVPLLLALRRGGLGSSLLLAFLWAELASSFVAHPLPAAISSYFRQPAFVGWAFAVGIWGFTASLYYLAFAAAYRSLAARFGRALPCLAAAAWVAVELGRTRLFTGTTLFVGNPWGVLGYSQMGWDELVQVASVTGVYGISFLLVLVNASLAELWLAFRARSLSWRRAVRDLSPAALFALAALLYGHTELLAAGRSEPGSEPVRVAVIQGNLDLGSRWRPEFYGRNLDTYLGLTLQALDAGKPAVVVWPEAALTFHLEEEPLFRRAIARVLAEGGAQLVVGGPHAEAVEPPIHYNSVFLLSEQGEVIGRYDKQHLLPFAEYVPLPGLELVRRQFGRRRVVTHGEPTPPLQTRAGSAGVLVCNEAMLPAVAATRVREGAVYLINPSNDSWIADPVFARMMFDLVSLRAVEQRRYLVRASTGGPSAVVDPWGRVRVATEPLSRGVILGGVHPRTELSLYNRLGDLFALACLASAGVALASRLFASRRAE